MLPPEDRPPIAARVEAAMTEVEKSRVECALVYAFGLAVLSWAVIGVNLTGDSFLALFAGLGIGAVYFLGATRGRIPASLHPYLVAILAPLVIFTIWIS